MPIYDFRNKDTGEVVTKMMSIASKPGFLEENPALEQVILSAPPLATGGKSIERMAGHEWNDVLKNVAEKNPYSPLANTHGKKDPTSVKLRETVKSVKKRISDD